MAALFSSLAFRLLLQLLVLAILPNPITIFASKPLGFSIDLIHRDSSLSPLYDPSSTLTQRAEQAALRSMLRSRQIASWFANYTSMISSPVMPGLSEFLMKLSLGTPPRLNWAIMDTGSDLIWKTYLAKDVYDQVANAVANAINHERFYPPKQDYHNLLALNMAASFSPLAFRLLLQLLLLAVLPNPASIFASKRLGFSIGLIHRDSSLSPLYDPSFTIAQRANKAALHSMLCSRCIASRFAKTTSIGPPSTLVATSYGRRAALVTPCAPNPALLEVPGLVGLGGGPPSLVNQIGSSIDKKFAYCFPPFSNENNSMGQIKIGKGAEFSGKEEVQETPMAPGGSQGTYYVLYLTYRSVRNNKLNIQFGGAQTIALLGDTSSRC
ncbi:hypothetical protein EJ110_NYTH18339 [Nymphaea thermarum]|nr:hypothetical protein EJ110_NYTH18339 [Nymphaea thermarum]